MPMKRDIILVGGGGHCRSCIDVIEQTERFVVGGIIDLPAHVGNQVLGYPVIGTDDDLAGLVENRWWFLVTLGMIGRPARRRGLLEKLNVLGANMATVISPSAYVSANAIVGSGTIIMHHAIVNTGAVVGANCIVNTRGLIEHDARIGDGCHISTGAIVNGGATLGSDVFFGSGAVAREMVTIGSGAFIAANSTVSKDVGAGEVLK